MVWMTLLLAGVNTYRVNFNCQPDMAASDTCTTIPRAVFYGGWVTVGFKYLDTVKFFFVFFTTFKHNDKWQKEKFNLKIDFLFLIIFLRYEIYSSLACQLVSKNQRCFLYELWWKEMCSNGHIFCLNMTICNICLQLKWWGFEGQKSKFTMVCKYFHQLSLLSKGSASE